MNLATSDVRRIMLGERGLSSAVESKIMGDTAQKLNKLMWLDLITGQGDRHGSNYFVHIDPDTHEVTVKGIDNDASFSATRIGLFKFALSKDQTALYEEELKKICQKIHGKSWKTIYENRLNDPAIVRNGNAMTIDLTKVQSHEAKMAILLLTAAGHMESGTRIEVSCDDHDTAYAVYAADGELEDSGADWAPLVKRF